MALKTLWGFFAPMTFDEIINTTIEPVVYSIDFPNRMFYVGRTIDIKRRATKHRQEAFSEKHANLALQRCFRKYHNQESWGIIKRFDSVEEAVQFEDSYIEEFWDDPLFLNQKRGDTIDAIYNERKHTKRVWYMNPYSGGMWMSNTCSEMRRMLGQNGYGKPVGWTHMAMGLSPEECEADAQKILADDFRKIIKPFEPKKVTFATLKWQAVKKEEARKKRIRKSVVVKELSTGKCWLSRKCELTSSQRRVLQNGVRPWSEFNVRLYGGDWAEFVPQKQQSFASHNQPRPIKGIHKEGMWGTWQSVGDFARNELTIPESISARKMAERARKCLNEEHRIQGWLLEYI